MRKIIYLILLLLSLSVTVACTGNERGSDLKKNDPGFDIAFATSYNERNVARADSAFDVLDSLNARNRAFLALFYNNAKDLDFENSMLYAKKSVEAYKSAVAIDATEADDVFELYGRELKLSLGEVHGIFSSLERELSVSDADSKESSEALEEEVDSAVVLPTDVPEQTIEEAIESVQL